MSARRVGEPVQVYLDPEARARLGRLARQLGVTKSGVLRQGLEALERAVLDPDKHPALQIVGLADRARGRGPGYNVARAHDRYLADSEEASWRRPRAGRPRRRGR